MPDLRSTIGISIPFDRGEIEGERERGLLATLLQKPEISMGEGCQSLGCVWLLPSCGTLNNPLPGSPSQPGAPTSCCLLCFCYQVRGMQTLPRGSIKPSPSQLGGLPCPTGSPPPLPPPPPPLLPPSISSIACLHLLCFPTSLFSVPLATAGSPMAARKGLAPIQVDPPLLGSFYVVFCYALAILGGPSTDPDKYLCGFSFCQVSFGCFACAGICGSVCVVG